ncbi:MAG: LysE family translocator [Frateuria sp.]|nr:LysE family translocator [Frateuria sp.]
MDPLWLFALLSLGIMVVPGMDMAFVLSSALVDGRRAGFVAVGGMVAAAAVHVAMGALGIGVLLRVAPAAFNALLAAGALYVGWIGWSLLRSKIALTASEGGRARGLDRIFGQAALTCLLNPKAYLFTLAVFPQVLRPERGSMLGQAVAMWAIVASAQLAVYGAVAVGAASVRDTLAERPEAQWKLVRAVGMLLLAVAAWTLVHAWRG